MKWRIKSIARVVRGTVLRGVGWLLAPIMRYVARYGYGSESCLANGFLALPVHYYSPIPELQDLDRRDVWARESKLAGINFRPDKQVKLLTELGERFGAECSFPERATADEGEFHLANDNFSFGCAASLHSIIRKYVPKRVVEIGSGNSSKVIARALAMNHAEGAPPTDYRIVDPYPSTFTRDRLVGVSQVIAERVEVIDPSSLLALTTDDILFIDTGHTVRIGGDVNFLFLDILPRLAPGVLVHVHDVNLPFEYEREYTAGQPGTFRRLWTEAYLLQAFLSCNRDFEVLLAMRYLMLRHSVAFGQAVAHHRPAQGRALSSSFWIRRVADSLAEPV
jgi:hypothetical protein